MNNILKQTIPFFAIFLVLASCKKNYSAPPNNNSTPDPVAAAITQGNWSVNSYTQKTEDKTSSLSGTIFTFSNDGKVSASNGGKSVSGTWSSSKGGITYYGGTPSIATFTISFISDNSLIKISKTWNVASESNVSLKLDNKEPLEDEHLSFSKN